MSTSAYADKTKNMHTVTDKTVGIGNYNHCNFLACTRGNQYSNFKRANHL